jgi:hypothetical protein
VEQRDITETHFGRKLSVSAYELRTDVWTWTYLIDSTIEGRCRAGAELRDADAALKRGLLAARARADGLK